MVFHSNLILAFLLALTTASILSAAHTENHARKKRSAWQSDSYVANKHSEQPMQRPKVAAYPTLPTFTALKEHLWRVNPSNSRTNCVACAINVVKWIKTGAAQPIEAENTERILLYENLLKDGRVYLRLNDDAFAKEILGAMPADFVNHEDAQSYLVEKVYFTPLALENLESTMYSMPLIKFSSPAGAQSNEQDRYFNYGLLNVSNEVNDEGVTMSHFLAFAVYENNKQGRNVIIIDGQENLTYTLKSFIAKHQSNKNHKFFIWYDSTEYRELAKITTKRPDWTIRNEILNLPSCARTENSPHGEAASPVLIKQEPEWSESPSEERFVPQTMLEPVDEVMEEILLPTNETELAPVLEEPIIIEDAPNEDYANDIDMAEEDVEEIENTEDLHVPPVRLNGQTLSIRLRSEINHNLPDISTFKVPTAPRPNRFRFELGTPRNLTGVPFFKFTLDNHKLSIHSVSGNNIESFLNAVGLDKVLQQVLLLSDTATADPNILYMLANEEAMRRPNANFIQIRNGAFKNLTNYRSFVLYRLFDDESKSVVNRVSGEFTRFVSAIDAIAYVNHFGLRIYEVEKTELQLLHEYVPVLARNVVSLVYCNGKFYPFVPRVDNADLQFPMPSDDWLAQRYPAIVTYLEHHLYDASVVRKVIYLNELGLQQDKIAQHAKIKDPRRISEILVANDIRNHGLYPNVVRDIMLQGYLQNHEAIVDGRLTLAQLSRSLAAFLAANDYGTYQSADIGNLLYNYKNRSDFELGDSVINNIITSYSLSARPSITDIARSANIPIASVVKTLIQNLDQLEVKDLVNLDLELELSTSQIETLILRAYGVIRSRSTEAVKITDVQRHLAKNGHKIGKKTIDRILKENRLPVLRRPHLSEKTVSALRDRYAQLKENQSRNIFSTLKDEFPDIDSEKIKAICQNKIYTHKYQGRSAFKKQIAETLPKLTPDQRRAPVKHLMEATSCPKRTVQSAVHDLAIPTEHNLKRRFLRDVQEEREAKRRKRALELPDDVDD